MDKAIVFCDENSYITLFKLAEQAGIEIVGLVFSKSVHISGASKIQGAIQLARELKTFDPTNQKEIADFAIDHKVSVLLVFSFDVILKMDLLDLENVRAINIHCGKLPKYRGANVLNWAIINGEKEVGIVIHEIDTGIDSGPIIAEWEVGIEFEDTALSVQRKLEESILTNAASHLARYLRNEIVPKPQSDFSFPRFRRRVPDDGLIDWQCTDLEIYHLIRALVDPWPGARYFDKEGNLHKLKSKLTLEEIAKLRSSIEE